MRTTSTFSILFWIHGQRADKNNLSIIYARITINGKKVIVSLKQKVNVDMWDSKRQKAKGNGKTSRAVNYYLDEVKSDIDFKNLGLNKKFRVIEIGAITENKGNVSQKFESIRLKVRGIIDNIDLEEIENYEPRLAFPESFYPKNDKKHPNSEKKIELVPKSKNKNNYFFVRPGVRQRFHIVLKIPENWTIIHIRVTFKYQSRFAFKYKETKGKDKETNRKDKGPKADIHTAERAFQIE